jgi:hypothetical protein
VMDVYMADGSRLLSDIKETPETIPKETWGATRTIAQSRTENVQQITTKEFADSNAERPSNIESFLSILSLDEQKVTPSLTGLEDIIAWYKLDWVSDLSKATEVNGSRVQSYIEPNFYWHLTLPCCPYSHLKPGNELSLNATRTRPSDTSVNSAVL